ncbi:MAG: peptide deformylase [Spirochaetales bacterium]|nr:peptide deformylase [Spirochaetales bacterium]
MEIKTLGDPVLEKKAIVVPKIDEDIRRISAEMIETMRNGRGVGLAAPQVGLSARMFVCEAPGDKPRTFINPEIISTSQDIVSFEEGCLSIPGIYADISRPASVIMQAWNEDGKPFTLEANGYLARIMQHEYDHLNGKLFIEHLDEKKKERLLKQYRKKIKK